MAFTVSNEPGFPPRTANWPLFLIFILAYLGLYHRVFLPQPSIPLNKSFSSLSMHVWKSICYCFCLDGKPFSVMSDVRSCLRPLCYSSILKRLYGLSHRCELFSLKLVGSAFIIRFVSRENWYFLVYTIRNRLNVRLFKMQGLFAYNSIDNPLKLAWAPIFRWP